MINQQTTNLSTGDIVRSFFRHARKAIAVFCLVVTATVCWIAYSPSEYESVAKIYVRVGRENSTLDPSATTGQTVNIEQTLSAEINSMLEVLESQETAEFVVAQIGADTILANDLPDDGAPTAESAKTDPSLVRQFKDWLSDLKDRVLPKRFSETEAALAVRAIQKQAGFSAPKNANVIEIHCTAGHPKLAQMIAKSWTDAFISEHLRITKTRGSLSFFIHQTEKIKSQLFAVEEDLKEAKSSSGLASIDGQRAVLEEQSKSIRARELTNQAMLESSQAKIKELTSILGLLPQRVEADQRTAQSSEGWDNLREKLFELQIREHELKSKYSDKNAEVIAVIEQREAIDKILASQNKALSESVSTPNPTYQLFQQSLLNEQAVVVSLVAEQASIVKQKSANLDELKQLNENAVIISELERQRQILETSYLASAAKMEQAKILEGLETARISSLNEMQRASFSVRPIGMGTLKTLMLGMIFGIFAGVVVASVAVYFDRSFVTAAQVENALDVPVLVSIPQGRRRLMEVN